jgi:flagellar export protein FliJ
VRTTTHEAEAAAGELAQAGARVEAARDDLLRAARDRRSLERLRELERAAFTRVQAGAERAVLDELGGVRDVFRRSAEQREAAR